MIITETSTDRKDFSTDAIILEPTIFTMRNLEPKYTVKDIAEIWLYASYHLGVNPNDVNKMFEIETQIVKCLNEN